MSRSKRKRQKVRNQKQTQKAKEAATPSAPVADAPSTTPAVAAEPATPSASVTAAAPSAAAASEAPAVAAEPVRPLPAAGEAVPEVRESAPEAIRVVHADMLEADMWDADEHSLAIELFRLTQRIGRSRDPQALRAALEEVSASIASILEADEVGFMRLLEGDGDSPARLQLVAAHGLEVGDEALVVFDVGTGLAGHVAQTGEAVRIADAPRDPRFAELYGQRTRIGSLLAMPLVAHGKITGVVTATRQEIRGFQAGDEKRLKTIALSVGADLENASYLLKATTDAITGLGNRTKLLTALQRETDRARRYQAPLSLTLMDIDGLKAVNTAYGRDFGDRVLAQFGRRLSAMLRQSDTAVRFGKDEFVVLMPMTDVDGATDTATRMHEDLRDNPIVVDGQTVQLTLSAGIAAMLPDDDGSLDMLERADTAITTAKKLGGQHIVVQPDGSMAHLDVD